MHTAEKGESCDLLLKLPSPQEIKVRLSRNYREAKALRQLLKLSEKVHAKRAQRGQATA